MARHKMPDGKPMAGELAFVDYDVSRLASQILERNLDEVILVPRGLVGPNGEALPVPQATAGTVGNVSLIER
jgi:hypothetical protein